LVPNLTKPVTRETLEDLLTPDDDRRAGEGQSAKN
jgi:hypothetical protein